MLHIAVRKKDMDEVKNLLMNTAMPKYYLETERDSRGQTPLMYSVILGQLKIMRYLLKHEQNVDVIDKKGFTALTHAAYQKDNNHEFISSLVEADADMNLVILPNKGYDWMNWKAIDLAFSKLHTENVKTLAELGSDDIGQSCMIASYIEGKTSISSSSLSY